MLGVADCERAGAMVWEFAGSILGVSEFVAELLAKSEVFGRSLAMVGTGWFTCVGWVRWMAVVGDSAGGRVSDFVSATFSLARLGARSVSEGVVGVIVGWMVLGEGVAMATVLWGVIGSISVGVRSAMCVGDWVLTSTWAEVSWGRVVRSISAGGAVVVGRSVES